MTEAPVDLPWDLEVALSTQHGERLERTRAWADLVEAVRRVVEPILDKIIEKTEARLPRQTGRKKLRKFH